MLFASLCHSRCFLTLNYAKTFTDEMFSVKNWCVCRVLYSHLTWARDKHFMYLEFSNDKDDESEDAEKQKLIPIFGLLYD